MGISITFGAAHHRERLSEAPVTRAILPASLNISMGLTFGRYP